MRLLAPFNLRLFLLFYACITLAVLGPANEAYAERSLHLGSGSLDPLAPLAAQKADLGLGQLKTPAPGEQRLQLLQWQGSVDSKALSALERQGGRTILPVREGGYLVLQPAQAKHTSPTLPGLRWAGPMQADWKLHPAVARALQRDHSAALPSGALIPTRAYRVQFALTGGEKALIGLILERAAQAERLWASKDFETWKIECDPELIRDLAAANAVFWIAPHIEPRRMGERGALAATDAFNETGDDLILPGGSYQDFLDRIGLRGNGRVAHIMDDGLSRGIATNEPGTAHPDILGRIAGIDNATADPSGNGPAGHGHLNASIIMGQPIADGATTDSGGYRLGQGIAPEARIYASKIFRDSGAFDTSGASLDTMIRRAWQAGARVSSNSWGAGVMGAYDDLAQSFDLWTRDADAESPGLQSMLFVVSAGNEGNDLGAGPGGLNSMGSPATAKNVISVGAAENNDLGPIDGSGIAETGSDDLRDIATFSSRGPTDDNRIGPTIVATGTHVTGAASDDPAFATQDASLVGVSGRGAGALQPGEQVDDLRYYPAFQVHYTWSSGTSHSTPIISGAVLLFEQYLQQVLGELPTPSLVRAAMTATAMDLAGGKRNNGTVEPVDFAPDMHQGWGRLRIDRLVDPIHAFYALNEAHVFDQSGQVFTQTVQVVDPAQPLRIALAWTDPPALAGSARTLINDLDLSVEVNGTTYLGNVFVEGDSVAGGTPDTTNNIEMVRFRSPQPGTYRIRVTARELLGDARPNAGGLIEQDFSLYAWNTSTQTPIGVVGFNREVIACGQTLAINLSDTDLRGAGGAQVLVESTLSGDAEVVTLLEADGQPGVMNGSIVVDSTALPVQNDGNLFAVDGETLRVTYWDQTTGENGLPLVSIDDARLDCRAPELLEHSILSIEDDEVSIILRTGEAARIAIEYGPDPETMQAKFETKSFASEHRITLEPLDPCETYFYTISLEDAAGNQRLASNEGQPFFAFQTLNAIELFSDDFEPIAELGWEAQTARGTGEWVQVVTDLAASPTHAWFIANPESSNQPGDASIKDAALVSPPLAPLANSRLTFSHTYSFEGVGIGTGYDGGVLEIATNGGTTWTDLGPFIVQGGYNATIAQGFDNPLAGREAWSQGSLGDMTPVVVDLAAFAGESVRIRFRFATDTSIASQGWYVDDVRLENLENCITELARLTFDTERFALGDGILGFTFADADFSQASGRIPGPFFMDIPTNGDPLPIVPESLALTDPAGLWQGTFKVEPSRRTGIVVVQERFYLKNGEWVGLLFEDPLTTGGDGIRRETRTIFDDTPPGLVSIEADKLGEDYATLRWMATEPARITLRYGINPLAPDQTAQTLSFSEGGSIQLTGLNPCTVYYYGIELTDRVGNTSVVDLAGGSGVFSTITFTTESDDLDPQPIWTWTLENIIGTTAWRLEEAQTLFETSQPNVYACPATPSVNDAVLVTPPFEIGVNDQFQFRHTYAMETGFDGMVLEISIDDGQSWIDLGPNIELGGYDEEISNNYSSPIAGRMAWTGGELGPMTEVRVNLAGYAGQTAIIRFRQACDSSIAETGWFIDDIVYRKAVACETGAPTTPVVIEPTGGIRRNNLLAETTLRWQPAEGATDYRVQWGWTPEAIEQMAETAETSLAIPAGSIPPGAQVYWRVTALGSGGAQSPGLLESFEAEAIDPKRIEEHILGLNVLSEVEAAAVDLDGDGEVTVNDLVEYITRLR